MHANYGLSGRVVIFCLQEDPWHACDTSKGFIEIENAGILNIEVHCIKGKLYKNEASNWAHKHLFQHMVLVRSEEVHD